MEESLGWCIKVALEQNEILMIYKLETIVNIVGLCLRKAN